MTFFISKGNMNHKNPSELLYMCMSVWGACVCVCVCVLSIYEKGVSAEKRTNERSALLMKHGTDDPVKH